MTTTRPDPIADHHAPHASGAAYSQEKLKPDGPLTSYCGGWFCLDKAGLACVTEDSVHSFRLQYTAVKDLTLDRFGRFFFDVKMEPGILTFAQATRDEGEAWPIVAMYKKFRTRSGHGGGVSSLRGSSCRARFQWRLLRSQRWSDWE